MARLTGTPAKYREHINASKEHGSYLTDSIKRHNMSADERSRGNHAKLAPDHPLHFPGYAAPSGAKPDGAGGRGEGRCTYNNDAYGKSGRNSAAADIPSGPASNRSVSERTANLHYKG